MLAPLVSVIIPVFNNADGLHTCIAAIMRQSYPIDRIQIIVVDNGSTVVPHEVVDRFPSATLLVENKRGSYSARNCGVQYANGEIIAFTDSDCIPNRDWIQKGVEALRHSGIAELGLVAGKIRVFPEDTAKPNGWELYEMLYSFNQERYVATLHYGATANLFTLRSVVDKIGAFDDALPSGGDFEWGRRVFNHGFMVMYCGEAEVSHPARRTWKEHIAKRRRLTSGFFLAGQLGHSDTNYFSLREIIRDFRPPIRECLKVLLGGKGLLPTTTRVRVCFALFGARYISAYFRLQYGLGFKNDFAR